ncbi:MAG TPA: thiamine pyrophosphate-dependent enzyme, partial [Thermoleophilaceae bacterium]|nr:thiamine pyrophosphate-dependent enzyme [Thermoleophilaceae bacterium]
SEPTASTTSASSQSAPVITTYSARGLIPPGHPCLVGLPPHVPEAGALWDEADVVLAVGSDLDGMMTQNWRMPKPSFLIAVNVDEGDAAKSYGPNLMLSGDAALVCGALVERLGEGRPAPDLEPLRRRAWDRLASEHPQEVEFVRVCERVLPSDGVVICDMCIPGYWLAGFLPVHRPRGLQYPMGWGTLGYAFPAAIGAALSGASSVVSISGDGGFLFACGELATVAQEKIPLTAVIVDDGGYGMLRYDQAGEPGQQGIDLDTPDFVALARSFGVEAERVAGLGAGFGAALCRHIADPAPSVLVADAALEPPPTTSPRWYRTG